MYPVIEKYAKILKISRMYPIIQIYAKILKISRMYPVIEKYAKILKISRMYPVIEIYAKIFKNIKNIFKTQNENSIFEYIFKIKAKILKYQNVSS